MTDQPLKSRNAGLNSHIGRFYRSMGEWIAGKLEKTPVTPNQVTFGSLAIAALASLIACVGHAAAFQIAACLLFIAMALDFADGSLARRKQSTSRYGWYCDNASDDLAGIFVAFGFFIGLSKMGQPLTISLTPFLTLVGDFLILNTMSRYRQEILDTQTRDPEELFQSSPLMNVARNIIPPVYLRRALFPIFALLGHGVWFLIADALATFALAMGFMIKTGMEIKKQRS